MFLGTFDPMFLGDETMLLLESPRIGALNARERRDDGSERAERAACWRRAVTRARSGLGGKRAPLIGA